MTPHHATDALTDRRRRAGVRKRRLRLSKLARFRVELVALRQAGATYRELKY